MILINKTYMRMRDSCERLAVFGRGCEVRAVAPVHGLAVALIAFAFVLFCPHYAFADSSIIWGPSVLPSQDIGVVVNAPDRYRAAALVLGHGDVEISTWSDEVLAKLSNESTGGAFYTFAHRFGEVDDALGHDNPLISVVSAIGDSFWAIAETLYGDDIWLAGYSAYDYQSAASALASVLAGESVGGGGGGGDIGSTFQITGADFLAATGIGWSSQYLDNARARTWNFQLDATSIAVIESYKADYPYIYVRALTNGNVDVRLSGLAIFMSSSPVVPLTQNTNVVVGPADCMYWQTTNRSWAHGGTYNLSFTSMSHDSSRSFNATSLYFRDFNPQSAPVPPTQWPDEPSAPSPPELPEPGTDVPVEPTPWAPVISPTFDFDLNITTEPTSNDLIDWVKKIYYELRNLHTDAKDWFDEMGKGLDSVVKAVNGAQRQIYSELQTIDDTLRDEGQKIRDYMYQMFHWLKDQLNFQNDSFNDSNIVYWLKRIWSKLGSGDINLRPTDPTSDPETWWDWLVKAIQNFLIGLAATSTELISEIADLASQVMHEFPFSIPWDIAAVLAALSTAPITPVFTVTVPAIDGWWNAFDVVIDMHPFDGAAETIRLMEKLLFTGLLIWKSKELLDFMDVTKWFGG